MEGLRKVITGTRIRWYTMTYAQMGTSKSRDEVSDAGAPSSSSDPSPGKRVQAARSDSGQLIQIPAVLVFGTTQ